MKLSGIYLIADVSLAQNILLNKINKALQSGVKLLQLYNVDNNTTTIDNIYNIKKLCHSFKALVLINNNWKLALKTSVDGVHFDLPPNNMKEINEVIENKLIKGLTLSNHLDLIRWAHHHDFNYFSFCSMFPSASAGECEIVNFESVQKARKLTSLPLFAAGGINLHNIEQLAALPIDGVAVISSIMNADNTEKATQLFNKKFQMINKQQ